MGWTTFYSSSRKEIYLVGTSDWTLAQNVLSSYIGSELANSFNGQNDKFPGQTGNFDNDDFLGWEWLAAEHGDYPHHLWFKYPKKFDWKEILLTDVKIIWYNEQPRKLIFKNGSPIDVPDI